MWAGVGSHEEECRTPELLAAGAGPPRLVGGEGSVAAGRRERRGPDGSPC